MLTTGINFTNFKIKKKLPVVKKKITSILKKKKEILNYLYYLISFYF